MLFSRPRRFEVRRAPSFNTGKARHCTYCTRGPAHNFLVQGYRRYWSSAYEIKTNQKLYMCRWFQGNNLCIVVDVKGKGSYNLIHLPQSTHLFKRVNSLHHKISFISRTMDDPEMNVVNLSTKLL